MVCIQTLNIPRNFTRPLRDNFRLTPLTPRLIAQLPSENRRALLISINNRLDISFISFLRCRMSVERGCIAAESFGIGVDAAEVVPVVYKGQHELDAVALGG